MTNPDRAIEGNLLSGTSEDVVLGRRILRGIDAERSRQRILHQGDSDGVVVVSGPTTWEAAASEALESIVPAIAITRDQESLLDELQYLYDNGAGFHAMGRIAVRGWLRANDKVTFEVEDHRAIVGVLADKQHDYGHQNILKHGAEGVIVRLWDKLARLQNLLNGGSQPKNESLVDTWLDLIGYCVIGTMLERSTFELPLAAKRPSGRVLRTYDPPGRITHVGRWDLDDDTTRQDFGDHIWALLTADLDPRAITVHWGAIDWTYEVAE